MSVANAAPAQRLNPLDAAWVLTESRATPNHVGGLLVFALPPDAPRHYLRGLMEFLRNQRQFVAPWNRRLRFGLPSHLLPTWVEDDAIDLEYHVRHAALPWPGGERELGELVGRLQSTPIDLTRPPWELTLIEGLSEHRFAVFVKMHHSLIDGVSGMKLLQRGMASDRAQSVDLPAFWAATPSASSRGARRSHPAPTMAHALDLALEGLRVQTRSLPRLAAAFAQFLKRRGGPAEVLAMPYAAPQSVLNGRVREKRRFATQHLAIDRLRAVASASGGTLNDVVLAVCGGALRRFLLERDELPDEPLTAGVPVSVRPQDDEGAGNAITFIVSTLGTDIADAVARMRAVQGSVKRAKDQVQSLPRQAMMQYTVLLMAPTVLTLLTGIGGRVRPMFNITISNVPGPDRTLYYRGAELLAIYPASIITHGQALNITCESYAGRMNFGFTGCHSSVPSMQKLAVYAAEALDELEAAWLHKGKAAARRGAKAEDAPARKPRRAPRAGAATAADTSEQAEATPTTTAPRKTRRRGGTAAAG